jgi:ABC-type transport system substrate-binding protein
MTDTSIPYEPETSHNRPGDSSLLAPVAPAEIKFAVFKCMPEPTTRVAALLAGEVSIIQAVPADLVDRLKKSKFVQILTIVGTRTNQIELNSVHPQTASFGYLLPTERFWIQPEAQTLSL